MIEVVHNPLLLDYIKVCVNMPEDERAQVPEFTGYPFGIDNVAIGCWQVSGPKWSIRRDGEPLVVGGFHQERPGVWRDFLLTTPDAWTRENWMPVTRACRRIMDSMFQNGAAHRMECVTPSIRVKSRPELPKWYGVLGYHHEATLRGYCVSGADAELFSRVKT